MKTLFKTTLLIAMASMVIYGCKKDKSKSASSGGTETGGNDQPKEAEWKSSIVANAEVVQLTNELMLPLNTKTITAAASGIMKLYFDDGFSADVYLPLRDKNGAIVTGTVKVEQILLRKKGDFIRQNRPTQTASAMLVTGGSFYLSITQGGEELTANYGFRLPQSSENFDLFEGADAGNNQNVWTTLQDSGRIQRNMDSISQSDTFFRYCCIDRFKWINCDYFYNCSCPLTAVKVKLPIEFGNTNTKVQLVFKDINAVTGLQGNITSKLFETGASYKAPIGKVVTIVVMSKIDGKYYFKTKEVNLIEDGVYEIAPTELTLSAMKSLIDAL